MKQPAPHTANTTSASNPLLVERRLFDPDPARTPFQITVFDTAVGSPNLGDQIIARAVYTMLEAMFPQAHLWSIPTHDTYGAAGRKRQRHSLFSLTTGTNLLSHRLPSGGLWKIPRYFRLSPIPFGHLRPRNLVLCAVGSNGHELPRAGARFLNASLWKDVPISARDEQTTAILSRSRVAGSLHTSCVTLWNLPRDHPFRLPTQRSPAVVVTLTGKRGARHASLEADRLLLDTLRRHYGVIHFWPQGRLDLEYAAMIGLTGINVLPHSLEAYTTLLRDAPALDYVGTRLHAGIHAIMHDRRSLIIPVDNRASDIGDSVHLPILAASDLSQLSSRIEAAWETRLDLPWDTIEKWKATLLAAVRTALTPTVDLTAFRGR